MCGVEGQERSLNLVHCHMPRVLAFRRRQEAILGHTVRFCLKKRKRKREKETGRKAGRRERKVPFGAGIGNIERQGRRDPNRV